MVTPRLLVCLLACLLGVDSVTKDTSDKDAELIDRLEKSLLNSFGLDERPKVDKKQVKVPLYMLHLYNQKVQTHLENSEEVEQTQQKTKASHKFSSNILANTVRSFTHSESDEDKFHPSHQMVFRFNVTSVPEKEILRHAELRLVHFQHPLVPPVFPSTSDGSDSNSKRKRWSKEELIYLHRVRVYDVVRPARGSFDPIYRLVDTRVIDARVNDTTSFDVSPVLKRWMSKPHTNYGIYVEVIPLKSNSILYKDATHVRLRRNAQKERSSKEWDAHQPLLVVYSDDQKVKYKIKRSAPTAAYKRPHCRRYNLYIDFRKVEWNQWIVAPAGYDAFFCQGECPYPLAKHMNATNHAVIQNIIHSRYPNRVPSACCVPIKHSAISMLYLDKDSKVVLKTYQDMIVESCGCQ